MSRPVLVYLAGAVWGDLVCQDRQLATRMTASHDVLWVDPPMSWLVRRGVSRELEQVAPHVHRLRVIGPPGVTRVVSRSLAQRHLHRQVSRACAGLGKIVAGVVLANPYGSFGSIPGRRMLFVTDDWVAGADLMGLSRQRISALERRNVRQAHVVAAVSANLAATLHGRQGREVAVVPNGCDPAIGAAAATAVAFDVALPSPVVGLLGQLNERLDLDVLDAVAERGVSILVVGPRAERDSSTTARLDTFLARDNVQWVGWQRPEDLPTFLASMKVGMTPYADTAFNRASSPLKTFDYLAAGLQVVATSLPAVSTQEARLIAVETVPRLYADRVVQLAGQAHDPVERQARLDVAARHSWQSRANDLLLLLLPDGRARGAVGT